ncbi:MAG TPA: hypothetical protein VMP03_09090, partial [Methylomirabilota bacterium]|nr:hypothetical protein [Methylomirabilota bacterium]
MNIAAAVLIGVTMAGVVQASAAAEIEANGDSGAPVFSHDGRWLAFESDASNLVDGDTNGVTDVFVLDLETGLIKRVSL